MIGVTLQSRFLKLNRKNFFNMIQQTLSKHRLLISSVKACFYLLPAIFNVSRKITLLIMEIEAISWNFLGPDHYQIITGNYFPLVFQRLLSGSICPFKLVLCVTGFLGGNGCVLINSNCQALCLRCTFLHWKEKQSAIFNKENL